MRRFWCAFAVLALAVVGSSAEQAALDPARQLATEGRHEEALAAVNAILSEDSRSPEALLLKGFLLAESGRGEEAAEVFVDLTRRFPQRPEPYNNLAVLLAQSGEYARSVEMLERALRAHPSYGTTYDNLTKVRGRLASRDYDRALGQESSAPTAGPGLDLLSRLEPAPSPFGDAVGPAEVAAEVTAPTTSPPTAAPDVAAEPPAEFDAAEVIEMVRDWARAWSERRVDDHLEFYSQSFSPSAELTRAAWAARRGDNITGSRFIEVELESIGVRQLGDRRAQARFVQTYRSDRFQDRVSKTLDLAWEEGGWKIRGEDSRPD